MMYLLIETAEDFHSAGADDIAHQWLGKARTAAVDQEDSMSLVDIELLSNALESCGEESRADQTETHQS